MNKRLAELMMKNMAIATLFVLFFGLFAYLTWLVAAPIALYTMRQGMQRGLLLMVISSVLFYGSMLTLGQFSPHFQNAGLTTTVFIGLYFIPVWLMSGVLAQTRQLTYAIISAVILMLLVIVVLYYSPIMPAADQWPQLVLDWFKQQYMAQGLTWDADTQQKLEILTNNTLFQVPGFFLLMQAVMLYVGRWWQALLYNPGGFGEEFRMQRLSKPIAFAAILIITLCVAVGHDSLIGRGLMLVVVWGVGLIGLGLLHYIVKVRKMSRGYLIFFYVTMVLTNFWILTLTAAVALLDSIFYLRERVKVRSNS